MKYVPFLCFALLLFTGCKKDDPAATLTLPANLVLVVDVSIDGTGKVNLTATADRANFYTVFFGDSPTETGLKSIDGTETHSYAETGTYTIKVQAHATQADFITESKTISISVGSNIGGIIIPGAGPTSPTSYSGMSLVFQDEFDGTSLNTSNWNFETGAGGWGNNELQYYRQENTQVTGGYLIISAIKESFNGSNYTSSRINTSGKKFFKYGRIDIRAAMPRGQGIWPALWMLGSNFSTTGWPACGEIDIMEMIGGSGRENTTVGTAHWDNGGHASYGNSKTLSSGMLGDQFHVYSIAWTNTSIIWYIDNVQYNILDTTPAALSEFQNNFFLIFNVAVGGAWPGNPNGTTVFPQHLIVDYVRVFQ